MQQRLAAVLGPETAGVRKQYIISTHHIARASATVLWGRWCWTSSLHLSPSWRLCMRARRYSSLSFQLAVVLLDAT